MRKILESVANIEDHLPLKELGESSNIVNEIVVDCQKKTIQVIKNPLAETVRSQIASLRKKLSAKISSGFDQTQHAQRLSKKLIIIIII